MIDIRFIRAREKALAARERLAVILYTRKLIDEEKFRDVLRRVDLTRKEMYGE